MMVDGSRMFEIGTILHRGVMMSVCVHFCMCCFWWLVFQCCCWHIKFMNLSVSVNIITGMYNGICGWYGPMVSAS